MRVIAIVNQKGGCGKTTTAVNLAGALAADGHRVLVVDLDPQAHATLALGADPERLDENLYEVFADPEGAARLPRVCLPVGERLDVAPSGIVLSALEQRLASEPVETRTARLSSALATLGNRYDFALIDCAPNVGLLTFNALLTERIGHELSVRILPTLYDGRTRYARQTLGEIREMFKDLCFDTVIRQNVKLREAASRGRPIVAIARSANGAHDYAALAIEVAASAPDLAIEPVASAPAPAREVVVRFRDRRASDVRIAGDFNGWVPDKGVRSLIEAEGETRIWTKILHLAPGRYQYRYVVDGEWREDPENPEGVTSQVGGRNSVLVVR